MPPLRYVVATDLSRASHDALTHAARLARSSGATLDLFCAVPLHLAEVDGDVLGRAHERIADWARKQSAEGLTTDCYVQIVDDVPKSVVDHARSRAASLVFVGPSGVTGWKKMVLGSVTEQLMRLAPAMLYVARGECKETPKKIVVALDRSPGAQRAYRIAVEFARTCGASLTVVHVVRAAGSWIALAGEPYLTDAISRDEERVKLARRGFEGWIAGIPHDGVDVEIRVVEGDPATAVLGIAKEVSAQLIVTGTHGKSRLHEFFVGSVARNVAATAPISVLMVRDRPPHHAGRKATPKKVVAPARKKRAGGSPDPS